MDLLQLGVLDWRNDNSAGPKEVPGSLHFVAAAPDKMENFGQYSFRRDQW